MSLKMRKNVLADKINALITSKPEQFDSDDEAEETKAKVVEHYEDSDASDNEFQQSKLRRQNIDILEKVDKRYAGKKVLRKEIYSDENNDENDDDSENMEIESNGENNEEMENTEVEQSDDQSDEEQDSQEISEDDGSTFDSEEEMHNDVDLSSPLLKQKESTIKTVSETNVKAEIEKGNCIRNQLKLWENILEMRIKLQKCVTTSNQMPQYDCYKEFRINTDFAKKVDETKANIALVLNKMLQLKDLLLSQYPETKNLCNSGKKIADDKGNGSEDEEIPSDTEDELENEKKLSDDENAKSDEEPVPRKRIKYKDYEEILRKSHSSHADYRDTVIKKWNEKTRIATGALNKESSQTTLKQIEFAMNDMSKLRRKTQLKRSEYSIVGKPLPDDNDDGRRVQEYDPEIFDDDDFYHQLLRDLIEHKSSDMTDPVQLSRQWIQLQNLRRKMKRKVDTRATKGRKVRYSVHNKLVNFMAPVTVDDTWTDSAKDELYNSLFGKINLKV